MGRRAYESDHMDKVLREKRRLESLNSKKKRVIKPAKYIDSKGKEIKK